MTFEEFSELMERRHSIRFFSDSPIDRGTLDKILRVGTLAPSVENTQPWHFHVILNAEFKKKMMEISSYGNFIAGAAAFVVVTCDRAAQKASAKTIWNQKELEYSCVAAMHSMMLTAVTLEIASCWVSLHPGPAHNLLKLPDHVIVVGGLMFGYGKEGENKPTSEHQRKPLASTVTYYE